MCVHVFFLILQELPNDTCNGTSSVNICCSTLVCLYDYKCVFRVVLVWFQTLHLWHILGPTYIFLFFKRWFPSYILGKFPKSLYTLFFNGCSNLHPFFWRPCHRLISGMSGRYGEQQVCQTHFCSWPGLVAMVFRMVYVPPFYPGYVCGICAPIEMMSLEKNTSVFVSFKYVT